MQSGESRPLDRSIVEGPLARAVWMLAWPTMLQNLIAGLQGVVDHALVGHFVGYAGNAAIGVAIQIFIVVIVFVISVFSGMGVLVARFAGANEPDKVNRTVYQAFLAAVALWALLLAPLGWILAPSLLGVVNAAPAVRTEALPFLRIMFVGSLGMLLFFMVSGALRAAGDARTPLRLGVLLTVLNIACNVAFITGLGPLPRLGTAGAAVGSTAAGVVVSGVAGYLLFSGRLPVTWQHGMDWRPDWRIIRELFRFGLPTGVQGIAMNVAGVLLLRFIGSLAHSAEAQAAYAVGYTELFSFITWTSVGLMSAAATVGGQNLGAGRPERAVQGVHVAAGLGLVLAAAIGVLFLTIPRSLLALFGMTDPVVVGLGTQLLGFLSVSGLFVTVALTYTGGLQGTGDTRSPLYISIVSQIVVPLGLCTLLQATRGLHAADIWTAILLGHITRCALSLVRFRQGKWRNIRVQVEAARL
ncbi:MAG TPA: MATE family efflux transporter [Gemmatimonadales bacterium]|nr:MATE family efflux transporter [Gemmatimonadales bacterium]